MDASPYKKVQFLLVNADTHTIKKATKTGKTWVGYRGIVGDPEQDAKARVDIISDVISASAHLASTNKDTLVVVLTPEFFFRPGEGSYTQKATDYLIDELRVVAGVLGKPNWLFAFGTVIGDYKGQKDQNTLVLVGEEGQWCQGITKKNTSGIDFVKEESGDIKHLTVLSIETKEYDLKGNLLKESFQEIKTKHTNNVIQRESESSTLSFFNYKGVSFCAETCLDHAANKFGIARTFCSTSTRPRAQVHLLCSAGMEVHPESVCAVPQGLLAHTDGLHQDRNTVYKVTENYTKDGKAKLQNLQDNLDGWGMEVIKKVPWFGEIVVYASPAFPLPPQEKEWK